LPVHRRSIRVSEMPVAVRRLQPHEIEDWLCIYRDRFLNLRT
jgi:hypothetical protein